MARFLHLCPSGRAAPGSANVKASSSSDKAIGNGKAKASGGGGGGGVARGGGSIAKAGYVLSSKEFEDMVSSQRSNPSPVPDSCLSPGPGRHQARCCS